MVKVQIGSNGQMEKMVKSISECLPYLLPVLLRRHVPAKVAGVVNSLQFPEDVHVRRAVHLVSSRCCRPGRKRSLPLIYLPLVPTHRRIPHFLLSNALRSLTDFAALIVHRRAGPFLPIQTKLTLSLSLPRSQENLEHFFSSATAV